MNPIKSLFISFIWWKQMEGMKAIARQLHKNQRFLIALQWVIGFRWRAPIIPSSFAFTLLSWIKRKDKREGGVKEREELWAEPETHNQPRRN